MTCTAELEFAKTNASVKGGYSLCRRKSQYSFHSLKECCFELRKNRNNIFMATLVGLTSSLILAANSPAQALVVYDSNPMQTLNVDSRANVFPVGQSKVFSASLDTGIWYKFSVTGQWTPDYKSDVYTPLESYQADPTLLLRNTQVPWRVDATFITLDSWSNASDYPWGYDDFGLFSSILGADDDNFWGPYNPTHAYEYEFLGTGSPVDFYVKDINFSDNFGGYTLQVYRQADVPPASVPGPLPLFGGGVAFGFSRKLRQRVKRASLR
jgi:hypothetical protein